MNWNTKVRPLPLLLFCCVVVAQAQPRSAVEELAQRFPPGSIATEDGASRALEMAARVHGDLAREFALASGKCDHVFFVNHCLDSARRVQRAGEHEVRRVTLEAHDWRRQRQEQLNAQNREEQQRRAAADDLQRAERERAARAASRAREDNAAARAQDALREEQNATQLQAQTQARVQQHEADAARQDALRPAQTGAARQQFEEKQRQAQEYARSRERDRALNEKRRAERQSAREAADAADAAARQKAPAPLP